jgi:hypothetical protein
MQRREAWHKQTAAWISDHISVVDARRFEHPELVSDEISGSFNEQHSAARNRVGHQLSEFMPLMDAQRPS